MKDTEVQMKLVLFIVFILLFVVAFGYTIAMVFHGVGSPTENERTVLFTAFIVEVAGCISALFYTVFNISKKNTNELPSLPSTLTSNPNKTISAAPDKPNKTTSSFEDENRAEEEQDNGWFTRASDAIAEGKLKEANKIFTEYARAEQDERKLFNHEVFFQYLLFAEGGDEGAVPKLYRLFEKSNIEAEKYLALDWISVCNSDKKQYSDSVKLWEEHKSLFNEEEFIVKSTVGLANAHRNNDHPETAIQILTTALPKVKTDSNKTLLYSALSKAEESLGNNKFAIYCEDKTVELSKNSKDKLFDVAYEASNQGLLDISISNYKLLLNLDSKNALAMNNLGVAANNLNINSIGNGYYRRASEQKNSLAMSNLGHVLLKAGLTDEAGKLGEQALKLNNTHSNVYELMSKVESKKAEDKEKWENILSKYASRQLFLRKFTSAYYEKTTPNINKNWVDGSNSEIRLSTDGNEIRATWYGSSSKDNARKLKLELSGKVKGSAFIGCYEVSSDKPEDLSLLTTALNNRKTQCLGVISEDGKGLEIISEDYTEELELRLKAVTNHS